MLNYVFIYVLDYLMYGPWKEKNQMVAQTPAIDKAYWLPDLGSSKINSVLIIVLALAVFLYFLLWK